MGLPAMGLNPRKVVFEGRDGLIRECDSLWGIRQGHGGYHFMHKGPKELQERILSLWPLVYQRDWPQTKELASPLHLESWLRGEVALSIGLYLQLWFKSLAIKHINVHMKIL